MLSDGFETQKALARDDFLQTAIKSLAAECLAAADRTVWGKHVHTSDFAAEAIQLLRFTIKGCNRKNCLRVLKEIAPQDCASPVEGSIFSRIASACTSMRLGLLRVESAITVLEVIFRLFQAINKEAKKSTGSTASSGAVADPAAVKRCMVSRLSSALKVTPEALADLENVKAELFRASAVECKCILLIACCWKVLISLSVAAGMTRQKLLGTEPDSSCTVFVATSFANPDLSGKMLEMSQQAAVNTRLEVLPTELIVRVSLDLFSSRPQTAFVADCDDSLECSIPLKAIQRLECDFESELGARITLQLHGHCLTSASPAGAMQPAVQVAPVTSKCVQYGISEPGRLNFLCGTHSTPASKFGTPPSFSLDLSSSAELAQFAQAIRQKCAGQESLNFVEKHPSHSKQEQPQLSQKSERSHQQGDDAEEALARGQESAASRASEGQSVSSQASAPLMDSQTVRVSVASFALRRGSSESVAPPADQSFGTAPSLAIEHSSGKQVGSTLEQVAEQQTRPEQSTTATNQIVKPESNTTSQAKAGEMPKRVSTAAFTVARQQKRGTQRTTVSSLQLSSRKSRDQPKEKQQTENAEQPDSSDGTCNQKQARVSEPAELLPATSPPISTEQPHATQANVAAHTISHASKDISRTGRSKVRARMLQRARTSGSVLHVQSTKPASTQQGNPASAKSDSCKKVKPALQDLDSSPQLDSHGSRERSRATSSIKARKETSRPQKKRARSSNATAAAAANILPMPRRAANKLPRRSQLPHQRSTIKPAVFSKTAAAGSRQDSTNFVPQLQSSQRSRATPDSTNSCSSYSTEAEGDIDGSIASEGFSPSSMPPDVEQQQESPTRVGGVSSARQTTVPSPLNLRGPDAPQNPFDELWSKFSTPGSKSRRPQATTPRTADEPAAMEASPSLESHEEAAAFAADREVVVKLDHELLAVARAASKDPTDDDEEEMTQVALLMSQLAAKRAAKAAGAKFQLQAVSIRKKVLQNFLASAQQELHDLLEEHRLAIAACQEIQVRAKGVLQRMRSEVSSASESKTKSSARQLKQMAAKTKSSLDRFAEFRSEMLEQSKLLIRQRHQAKEHALKAKLKLRASIRKEISRCGV